MNTNQPIKSTSMTDAVVAIAAILTSSYQKLGYRFDVNYPLEEMALDVYNMLQERHPNVSMEQVNKAVSNGINGDYGEVHGLAPVDIVRFVKEYTVPQNIINYQAPEEKKPLQLERDVAADTINLMQTLYMMWKKNEPIIAFPAGKLICFLWKYNLLLNVKEKNVQDKYITQAHGQLLSESDKKRKLSIGDISTVTLDNDSVKNRAYKLIIFDFFKDCKERGIENLHELFNN